MKNKSIGNSWEEVRKELFTDEEINASNMRITNYINNIMPPLATFFIEKNG